MSVYEPITEGWGRQLLSIGTFIGAITSIARPDLGLGISVGSFAAIQVLKKISKDQMKKILTHPAVKKYITQECDRIYKKVAAYYKSSTARDWSFSKKVSQYTLDNYISDDITNIDKDYNYHLNPDYVRKEDRKKRQQYLFIEKIGEYTIGIYADSDHIEGMHVLFSLMNKEREDEPHLVHYNIPAPTNTKLKELGFREE